MNHPLIQSWLLQSAVIFLIVGSLAALVVGALLVFRPQRLQRIGALLNRWVSTRNFDKNLERSFSIDPWFYRYRKINGTLTLLGALYVVFFFTVQLDREAAIAGLAKSFRYPHALVGALLDALVLSALTGALCAAFVAIFMLLRPSSLRGFEQEANQWLSLRRALKPLETPREDMENFVLRNARQVGIFLLLGALYTRVFMLSWLIYQG
ncbi:MAG: hypothetical protein PHQ60_11060 [Sideroxydans sp.]|nr:hypothetical protein [Sideroxydans sp.]